MSRVLTIKISLSPQMKQKNCYSLILPENKLLPNLSNSNLMKNNSKTNFGIPPNGRTFRLESSQDNELQLPAIVATDGERFVYPPYAQSQTDKGNLQPINEKFFVFRELPTRAT